MGMFKGITKLLIVHLKETSIVKKKKRIFLEKIKCKAIGGGKGGDNNCCFFLATIFQANISFLQADQAWSLDWNVLGLREPGRCHQNMSSLWTCSA